MSSSPVLVHTDVARLDRKILRALGSNSEVTETAILYLKELTKKREMWLPAFNYTYSETRKFDVLRDRCEVGIINETLRTSSGFVRSEVPIFSLIRNHSPAMHINLDNDVFEPFGSNGEFAELFDLNGEIMFFGARFNSLTQIHRVEELAGINYRYFKNFKGVVHNNSIEKRVNLRFQVRPKGFNLQYDWDKIYLEIEKAGMITFHGHNIFSIQVVDLHKLLLQRLRNDELWMLTAGTKRKVDEVRRALGRDYELGDFE
jgi:aminoglycoside 3-N-acetyltransferase